jgi:hypothetical protein
VSLVCSKCKGREEVKSVKLFWDTLIVAEGYLCVDCMEFVSGEILAEFGMLEPKSFQSWMPKAKYIFVG